MANNYDFWIDFENKEIYRFEEQIPKKIKNNFIDVESEVTKEYEHFYCMLCTSKENYQHYTTNDSSFFMIVDWKHHFWANDGETLLNNLSMDEVFAILKEKNKTTAELLRVFETQFDSELTYKTIDYLLDDNVSFSESNDIDEEMI